MYEKTQKEMDQMARNECCSVTQNIKFSLQLDVDNDAAMMVSMVDDVNCASNESEHVCQSYKRVLIPCHWNWMLVVMIVQPNVRKRNTDKWSHEVVIMKQNWWLIAKLIFQYASVSEFIEIAIESWTKIKSESVAHAVIKRTIMTRFYRYCGRPTVTLKNSVILLLLQAAWTVGPFSTKNSITSLFFPVRISWCVFWFMKYYDIC